MNLLPVTLRHSLRLGHASRGKALASSLAAPLAALLGAALLTGCATGPLPTQADGAANLVAGNVHGGQQPVTGATVQLYATTSANYGGTPTLLGTTTSNSAGNFTFTAPGSCPAGQQAYVVASSGNPGLAAGTNNSALLLVAALGPCTSLNAATLIDINEVTTVAAAYALAGFIPVGGQGFVTGNITGGVTTSTANVAGLSHAFANAANMVNFVTGTAYTTTPTSGSTGTVPQATIYTVADILQDCVNSGGPGSTSATACRNLFTAATPPTGTGVATPVNVFQAALDIARYPGNNVGTLYGLVSAAAAFQPTLSAQPNDLTLGLSFTSTNLVAAAGLAIDAADNVYTVGYPTAPAAAVALLEFSPQGALLSPATGWNTGSTVIKASDNVRDIKIDPSGNLFLADGNVAQILEYTPAGTPTAPTTGTLAALSYASVNTDKNNYALAVDGSGDVFTSSYKQNTCATGTSLCAYTEFPVGSFATPTITFGGGTVTLPSGSRGMAADATTKASRGLVWATDNNANMVQILNPTTGATTVTLSAANACAFPYGVALDANGNAWIAGAGNTLATGATGSTCATTAPPELFQVSPAGTVLQAIANTTSLNVPFNVAIDGAGNVFTTNSGASTIAEYSPTFNSGAGTFLSPNAGFAPSSTYSATAGTVSGGPIAGGRSLAVDKSGALWVLSPSAAGTLVQILGVAAPVNPVLSTGGYGVQP